MKNYDEDVYKRLWGELRLSNIMQKLVNYPFLMNLVVNRANNSPTLHATLSSMFDDVELRKQLSKPGFYLKLLAGK